jgi:hypothetical protein
MLLYLTFSRFDEALLLMVTLPLALMGGVWLLYLLGHNLSVAGVVGFIALAGVAAEFGVIMLLYLKQAWQERLEDGRESELDLARRYPRRCGSESAAQGDHSGNNPGRPAAHHAGQRYRQRSDAAHRCAHAW